jgi:hypothetical protein
MKMRSLSRYKRAYLILLLPIGVALSYICSFFPLFIERYYSIGINGAVISALSIATGILPFSLAEMLVIFLVLSIVWRLRALVILLKLNELNQPIFLKYLTNLIAFVSIVYFAFILLWGLNYNRISFANIAHFSIQPATTEELADLCANLIDRTNRLRVSLDEDQNGVMRISGGKASILNGGYAGYEQAAAIYPELGGKYGKPKGLLLSNFISYLGFAGVYCPFTGEANVNMAVPDALLPSTLAHEMAHQRGFAREDEANYIAYLTCLLNPDPDFQYSGNLLAVIHAMNMLKRYDIERYNHLQKNYSNGVRQDLIYYSDYVKKHVTILGKISNDVNDLYLKSNRQVDGVYSYNRMVDLLIAESRNKKNST